MQPDPATGAMPTAAPLRSTGGSVETSKMLTESATGLVAYRELDPLSYNMKFAPAPADADALVTASESDEITEMVPLLVRT